jgi:4-diphosphocytidyl-2-C-methyl-D-erythritol kinase
MLLVLDRRTDGYHNLQTVFQFLDHGDELRFCPRTDGHIRLMTPQSGIPPEQDLITRAALLLKKETNTARGADIWLHKRIPLGGGLGGGSSNAATALVALNQLWQLGLDTKALIRLGVTLGADVPIFVSGQAAWAEGVGERLNPLTLPCPWYLVLTPDCHVSTGQVFADPELTRNAQPSTIADFLLGHRDNSCEPLVRRKYPKVDGLMHWLGQFTRPYLTGTGASVFGILDTKAQAQRLLDAAKGRYQGFIAKGLNRSPLMDGPRC